MQKQTLLQKKQQKIMEAKSNNMKVLAEMDLFFMLGLQDSKPDEKTKLFMDLQENVWMDVIGRCLEKELNPEKVEQLKVLLQDRASTEQVIPFLSKNVKNFSLLLFEATLAYKKRYFIDYLEVLGRIVQAHSRRRKTEDSLHKLELLGQISELASNDQWDSVENLLPQFNSLKIS